MEVPMNKEQSVKVLSGWIMAPVTLALYAGAGVLFWQAAVNGSSTASGGSQPDIGLLIAGIVALFFAILSTPGYFTLQPNEARLLILFGSYRGTTRQGGFCWGNPFYANGPATQGRSRGFGSNRSRGGADGDAGGTQVARRLPRYKVSLRARTLNGDRLKVNDKAGNPIEIAAVIVWHVEDTAQAIFDVDDFEAYVSMQSETALRHLATAYAYDHGEDEDSATTLRGNVDDVSQALRVELQERLAKAGVTVDEARLTHLAYAPEIAQTMLRRQQAEAVIAARKKIVRGAVSMVEQALNEFNEKNLVEFDPERRAAMVSNLMVVLCGESQVTPVINTGTLYQ
jgi:regulator of protease activity HflC (stomatin/prohibitin superfamily)